MKTLETPRLILRDWSLDDAPDLFEYAKSPQVGPAAGWTPHQSLEESVRIIQSFIHGNDVWAVFHKETRKVIGSVGLHDLADSTETTITKELGYVLSPRYEGQGLMTEACRRVIRYAFDEQSISLLKVDHFLENDKSRRVIEKCGFILDGLVQYRTSAYGIQTAQAYHLTKKEYSLYGGFANE